MIVPTKYDETDLNAVNSTELLVQALVQLDVAEALHTSASCPSPGCLPGDSRTTKTDYV